jgi:flavin-dependent dehydrogenase
VPALAQILHSLGASEALNACEPCLGICSSWGRPTATFQPSIINPLGHAWFVHRGQFDNYLRQTVCEAGTIWVEAAAQSVNFDHSGVSVETTGNPVRARWLVAATGSPSWPAHITKQTSLNIDTLVALWARIPAKLEARLLFVEPTDHGWWYVCPGDGENTVTCFVTDPPSAHALGVSQAQVFNQHFQVTRLFGRFSGMPPPELVRAAPSGIAELPRKYGDRWIAVGDAAVKLDPLGSSGTVTALDSGRRAALAISGALQGKQAEIDRYGRWSEGLVREFIRQRNQQYATESSRRTSGFWHRREEKAA